MTQRRPHDYEDRCWSWANISEEALGPQKVDFGRCTICWHQDFRFLVSILFWNLFFLKQWKNIYFSNDKVFSHLLQQLQKTNTHSWRDAQKHRKLSQSKHGICKVPSQLKWWDHPRYLWGLKCTIPLLVREEWRQGVFHQKYLTMLCFTYLKRFTKEVFLPNTWAQGQFRTYLGFQDREKDDLG